MDDDVERRPAAAAAAATAVAVDHDAPSAYRRLLPPARTRRAAWTRISASVRVRLVSSPVSSRRALLTWAQFVLKDTLRLHTLLAVGAGLQLALSAAVDAPWSLVPAVALLSVAAATTLAQMLVPMLVSMLGPHLGGRSRAPCRRRGRLPSLAADVVSGRSTAHLGDDGGPSPGIVVFHFGARFNHPLGLLAPGARTMTALFRATMAELDSRQPTAGDGAGPGDGDVGAHRDGPLSHPSPYGLLGADLFRGGSRAAHNTLLLVMYFRDAAGLRRFAVSAVHVRAQRWLETHRRHYAHLSAFHETFCVPAGAYETLYINTAPVLLGGVRMEGRGRGQGRQGREQGREQEGRAGDTFYSPLVDADDDRLQTMTARLQHGAGV